MRSKRCVSFSPSAGVAGRHKNHVITNSNSITRHGAAGSHHSTTEVITDLRLKQGGTTKLGGEAAGQNHAIMIMIMMAQVAGQTVEMWLLPRMIQKVIAGAKTTWTTIQAPAQSIAGSTGAATGAATEAGTGAATEAGTGPGAGTEAKASREIQLVATRRQMHKMRPPKATSMIMMRYEWRMGAICGNAFAVRVGTKGTSTGPLLSRTLSTAIHTAKQTIIIVCKATTTHTMVGVIMAIRIHAVRARSRPRVAVKETASIPQVTKLTAEPAAPRHPVTKEGRCAGFVKAQDLCHRSCCHNGQRAEYAIV